MCAIDSREHGVTGCLHANQQRIVHGNQVFNRNQGKDSTYPDHARLKCKRSRYNPRPRKTLSMVY
ncbi:uncharacterized protein PHALS_11960 [Plasmopara halstedii]|uniref:Uncharacterized protein n=1 Tax=Plasmopara halstedii TaxID=4781 RepID=A0A0N7L5J2_PLAHL|nr:uncharacterized protein PHALS_11960 [Plasmopara halstedii]CEG41627.1 hypothetical protein PHALS_11960 [Plasmopara halstedii]|eukprot:XP_024577996.1 hypothetical protein PHALS_11960 [Plasmopara halstedii]